MFQAPFRLVRPEQQTTSVFFASPHSGRDYPWAFIEQTMLDEHTIRSSEDAFVDEFLAAAPECGAPVLIAGAPRAYVDVNRSADELDPALISGVRRNVHNPRVASGLGVIPRVVANGRAIYRGKLSREEAETRIAQCWRPYHDALRDLFETTHGAFGEAILVDLHSMPHEAIEAIGQTGAHRPDVVIGDRFGAAASGPVVAQVEASLKAAGLRVARNAPFAGAFVTQHYGRPGQCRHVVQIEIDRALYMDEARIRPRDDFGDFVALMAGVVADIAAIGARSVPLAAE